MFITAEILQQRGACQEYLDFFQKHYPNGVEMIDMIERGHMPYHALHWGYKWLDPNEEEVASYWKRVCVENSEGVDESDHVSDSSLIVNSSRIEKSSNVIGSTDVFNSEHIHISQMVDSSKWVQSSSFVDGSTRILDSKNVEDSSEVVNSVYIIKSHGVFDSNNVVEGHTIWHSINLTNCGFCFHCSNLMNALFCINAGDGEYMLFNKPIDAARFDRINKQFRRYATAHSIMTDGWSEDLHCAKAKKIMDYRKHTKDIPVSFWEWVKTLPGYDTEIMYSLTFNPQYLN